MKKQDITELLGLNNPVISPLDFTDGNQVVSHLDTVGMYAGMVKVGSQVLKALGELAVVELARERDLHIMWDEKLADIPFQVGNAVGSISRLASPNLLTVHASAGSETVKAAVENAGPNVIVTCISVLTSISPEECLKVFGSGRTVEEVVRDLALLAVHAGAGALVCSPRELLFLREQEAQYPELGDLYKIVPGIRSADSPPDDQMRKATPFEAAQWGADMIVVGRLISKAPDPSVAIQQVTKQFQAGVLAR